MKKNKIIDKSQIQVNPNISTKVYFIILITVLVALVALTSHLVYYVLQTKNYTQVKATITNVGYRYTTSMTKNQKEYYYQFTYNYNNQNYTNEMYYTLFTTKKKDQVINIYVNPNNPKEIRNTHFIKIEILIIIILLTMFFLIFLMYSTKKRQKITKKTTSK